MRPPSPSPSPLKPCLVLLQTLRESPGAWLLRLGWTFFFGLPCEVVSWAGLPVYTPYTAFQLQATWVACLVLSILLTTHAMTDWSKFGFFLFVALVAAIVMVMKDDAPKRRADIATLAAAAEEAGRKAQQVPESLRNVLTTFGASATAAAELAQAALDGVNRTTRRLGGPMHRELRS